MAGTHYSNDNKPGPYVIRARALVELGYVDYKAYLASAKWAEVSRRILAKKECYVCGIGATVAHHISYSKETLDGNDDSQLFPLCRGCHAWLHDDNGSHVPADRTIGKMKNARNARLAHEAKLLDTFRRKQAASRSEWRAAKVPAKKYRRRRRRARFDPSASNAIHVTAPTQ